MEAVASKIAGGFEVEEEVGKSCGGWSTCKKEDHHSTLCLLATVASGYKDAWSTRAGNCVATAVSHGENSCWGGRSSQREASS